VIQRAYVYSPPFMERITAVEVGVWVSVGVSVSVFEVARSAVEQLRD
jgi:hypothetical protein